MRSAERKEGAMASTQTSAGADTDLVEGFDVTDTAMVHNILADQDSLVPLLRELRSITSEVFGPATAVMLRSVIDPESPVSERDLLATIQAPLSLDEAMDALDRLDALWWLDASPREGRLIVDADLV
jgi:hypothetical protein